MKIEKPLTQEQKLQHVQVMLSANRVLYKRMMNIIYQINQFQDSASFVLAMNDASILRQSEQLEIDYVMAENIVKSDS